MYSYTFDPLTGGIILNSTPTLFSKEPRPVYAEELDILGFDQYWEYDRQDEVPYMWAESNVYWYRGVKIAEIKGGDLHTKPELKPVRDENGNLPFGKEGGEKLLPIDIEAMIRANTDLMTIVVNSTVKKIVKEYEKFKKKLDIFHVAFSGGKDSVVLLDLVKKALPRGSFVVIFGDTGMEFPDTYKTVEKTKRQCEADDTPFFIARSHFDPKESWAIFGPPARKLRWCCSVHKSTPQTLKLREITGKDDYVGLDFVGVRSHESAVRSTYEYENFGKKQKGQYSYNPILEWTSAEVWLYLFANQLPVNDAYKKGNARAGCLICPMSTGASVYFRRNAYRQQIDEYVGIIEGTYHSSDINEARSFVKNGGWCARNNGRGLRENVFRCVENVDKGNVSITVTKPTEDWKEWIKTIGPLTKTDDGYTVLFEGEEIAFQIENRKNGYTVTFSEKISVRKPKFSKLLKQVFHKTAYCIACKVCETNCRNHSIRFVNGKLSITNCLHCYQCHDIDSGCLLFHSLRHPQGGGNMRKKSLNSFADHAPKTEWLVSFFNLKERFFTEHSLGPMMYDMFRRFLKDAGLNEKNHFTEFAQLINEIGWECDTALGLMLVNLAMENPQIAWYINNMDIDHLYLRKEIEEKLLSADVKPKDAKSIVKAFKRIVETPFGTVLNFGYATDEDELVRTRCSITDNRVVLYAIYMFAEKCNLDEFSLSYLYDDVIQRDAISPVRILGLYDEEEMKKILKGLASTYTDFIDATFTNDLKTITLRNKRPSDILALFKEN